jgi:DNA polymerase III sliding clamp (beta) subunit (PCNA family)
VGESFSASFNPGFILEGLKASHTEQIELLMDDPTRPAKFILGENYEYVVMPLAPGV